MSSLEEFNKSGNWGTVASTAGSAILSGAVAYAGSKLKPKAVLNCFVAGTKISTPDGLRSIEEIRAGDIVYSKNVDTGEKGTKSVIRTFINKTNELIYLQVNGEEIITTPEHLFHVDSIGWVKAGLLSAGDPLVLLSDEIALVEQVRHEILETPIDVYNFEVEDWHTYFVSDSNVLVHNDCSGEIENIYSSAKKAPNYPTGFQNVKNGTKKVKI
jgi:hypothetical protein